MTLDSLPCSSAHFGSLHSSPTERQSLLYAAPNFLKLSPAAGRTLKVTVNYTPPATACKPALRFLFALIAMRAKSRRLMIWRAVLIGSLLSSR